MESDEVVHRIAALRERVLNADTPEERREAVRELGRLDRERKAETYARLEDE
ncbi:hypothetical protein [Halomarina litorea]|uniref:hypothetical protein n=1 Tax=Halomarina litorea TaxID=2961595 RepID=UPI0020C228F6|nr:hypothetical protein [Halomarina sp. BCD28]